ncbi:MAG: RDD family protein [Desulfuromonadaceae bacterium]|nr:RDD family protein [Desulfuromonas sp.]MDY0185960.1 RDD family protein [Desulfuromonadaceae bacterium]
MLLICPHCNFTRELEDAAVPVDPVQVTCPKCNGTFPFEPKKDEDVSLEAAQYFNDASSAPPAGFWVRVVAALLDSMISGLLQYSMVFALGTITRLSGTSSLPSVQILTMLFGTLAGVFYYVFFTGYSGQTPGKMLLRLKVVRLDGSKASYGQAFLRETIGKFISGIILGIGYFMVALRTDKRALHDLMADTRVIRI